MELKISHSSLRIPPFISCRFMASSHVNTSITIRPRTKDIKSCTFPSKCSPNKLIQPIGIYEDSRFSKALLSRHHNRNFIPACSKLEFAGSEPVLGKDQPESTDANVVAKVLRFGSTFYTFTRPYTMTQVFMVSTCLFARVLVENGQLFERYLLIKAFPSLVALLLANIYFNGINQIFDADIDRINKPYLPIPAGDLSLQQAWLLTILSVFGAQLILLLMKADLITTCLFSFGLLLATLYCVPPCRFKRSHVATVILIPLMSVNNYIGVLYATIASLGLSFQWSPPIIFIITFVALFFVVICLIKDMSDVEGDIKYNIQTFAAIFGPKNVAFFGTGIMLVTYIGAIATAIYMPQAFKCHLMLPAHSIFAFWLLFQARKLDKANYVQEASANFYEFLWKLLTLEFLLFPFI